MIRRYKTRDGESTFRVELDLGARSDPKTGTRRRGRVFAAFDTKAEALQWQRERKARARADRQAFLEPSREPLHECLTAWLARRQRELRPTAWSSYEIVFRLHVLPVLGRVSLAERSPAAI